MTTPSMEEIFERLGTEGASNVDYGTVVYGAPFTPLSPAYTSDAPCNQVSRGRSIWVSHDAAEAGKADETPTAAMLRRGCQPTGQTRVSGGTLQTQWCCPGPLVGTSGLQPGAMARLPTAIQVGGRRIGWGSVLLLLASGAGGALLLKALMKEREKAATRNPRLRSRAARPGSGLRPPYGRAQVGARTARGRAIQRARNPRARLARNLSTKQLQLYCHGTEGIHAAAEISAALQEAVEEVTNAAYRIGPDVDELGRMIGDVFKRRLHPVMLRYGTSCGSYDTEPLYVVGQKLVDAVKEVHDWQGSYMPELGDWLP